MMHKTELVYIIDDDPIVVYSIKRIMKELDFCKTIMTFENGQIALERLLEVQKNEKQKPDIIFLDLTMPVMNGWTFLQEFDNHDLKRLGVRIMVISSSVNPTEIAKINSFSFVEKYIVKPVTPSDLKQISDG